MAQLTWGLFSRISLSTSSNRLYSCLQFIPEASMMMAWGTCWMMKSRILMASSLCAQQHHFKLCCNLLKRPVQTRAGQNILPRQCPGCKWQVGHSHNMGTRLSSSSRHFISFPFFKSCIIMYPALGLPNASKS